MSAAGSIGSRPCCVVASPVCVVILSDGEVAEGDVHDGVPRGDEAVEQAERHSHQQGVAVAVRNYAFLT